MSVVITEGVPGAGKTFDTIVRFLVPAIKSDVAVRNPLTKEVIGYVRRRVWTNIAGLNFLKLAELTGRTYEEICDQVVVIEDAKEWRALLQHDAEDWDCLKLKHLAYSMVIVDEAQMIYPRGDFRNTPQSFKNLLAYHRHNHMDMIFLTQSSQTLEGYVAEICDRVYSVKNLGFVMKMFGNRYVIHVREKPRQPNYSTMTGTYDKKYFGVYESVASGGSENKLAMPNAVGGVFAAFIIGSLAVLGVHFYSHGLFTAPKGIKLNVASHSAGIMATGGDPQKVLGVSFKDAVADNVQQSLTPRELNEASAVAAGRDPRKKCYSVPVKSSWFIEFPKGIDGKPVEAERGWKDSSKTLCF